MNELIDSFSHIIDSYLVLKDRKNPKINWCCFFCDFNNN